ncbi:unnamed protein product, partial [Ectocarpus sp. 12 AP-2014]
KALEHIKALPEERKVMAKDSELIEQLGISRTSLRVCIDHLLNEKIIVRRGKQKIVLRQPASEDFYNIKDAASTKDQQFEKYFIELMYTGELVPGGRFSELSLARKSKCTTITVREFLIQFARNGLIKKIPRGQWQMVEFDNAFANELIDFREMVEMYAFNNLLKTSQDDPVWVELKDLLEQHKEVRSEVKLRYHEFPNLDKALHYAIRKPSGNRFADQFYDIASFICHYHYQWDKEGEVERFTVALDEHIAILEHLLAGENAQAILSMKNHLGTAQKTLLSSVRGLST